MKRIEIPQPSPEVQLHRYVAWGCPFCHRVLAALALTGLGKRVVDTTYNHRLIKEHFYLSVMHVAVRFVFSIHRG